MLDFVLKRIIGTQNERALRKLQPLVDSINNLEPEISKLSDADLRAKTDEFRRRVKKEEEPSASQLRELKEQVSEATSPEEKDNLKQKVKLLINQTLEPVLQEAFAVVREAGKRAIGMRHFDVQLIGGFVLHQGKIAEMATGEGKTLVATLAAYLNGLTGKGVHIVTVNDYLARRDREWMGPIYEFLGLSVGAIQHDMDPAERKKAYGCDITYGTNNEFGFDYLRDNMVLRKEDMVQRPLHYAIVDEVDSILVDEARTPLIISGPAEESTDKYYKIDRIIPQLEKGERDETTKEETGDFILDEKAKTTYLTEAGELKAARLLGLSSLHDIEFMEYKHHISQALKAHNNFTLDVDYMLKEGEVLIVDEFTGRLMPGRRWSDGLHQAIEAKEGVQIKRENQTLATITFQNYFRMYDKLAGMTGTAATEAGEFYEIYKLEVLIIPPNRTLVRTNHPDVIYKTEREKFNAVVEEIAELHSKGRPVLVGTISIEKSEHLSRRLKAKNVPHHVLNAKYHEMEAEIVAQAGRRGAVTIATNMAGRGTDILLGGNAEFLARELLRKQGNDPSQATAEEYDAALNTVKGQIDEEHKQVVEVRGLHVLGTERHESRRIDNQLRGRSGRQGDPGSSRFYLSLEDDLMRIFGSDRIKGMMERLGMEEGQDIQHPLVTRAIGTAQRRVEEQNFEIRKQLLKYDNVMNRQREVIYGLRRRILEQESLKPQVLELAEDYVDGLIETYAGAELHKDERDLAGLGGLLRNKLSLEVNLTEADNPEQIRELILEKIKSSYEIKENEVGNEVVRHIEKVVMLNTLDSKWKEHLYDMDSLREGIGLRGYGQRDPLIEYQREGYDMFSDMIQSSNEEILEFIFRVESVREEGPAAGFRAQQFLHPEAGRFQQEKKPPLEQPVKTAYQREGEKVGRNDPCPCGSGKKYKKCCGK